MTLVFFVFFDEFAFLFLLSRSDAHRVYTKMSLFKEHLIELDFGFLATLFFLVKDVSILAVFKVAKLLGDDLGPLRFLRVFHDANRPEPNLFDLATGSEKFLEFFGSGVARHVADKDCAGLALLELECGNILVILNLDCWGASVFFGDFSFFGDLSFFSNTHNRFFLWCCGFFSLFSRNSRFLNS